MHNVRTLKMLDMNLITKENYPSLQPQRETPKNAGIQIQKSVFSGP